MTQNKHKAQVAAIEARQKADREYWGGRKRVNSIGAPHLEMKKRPLRLLSLDGGGVRGIVSLVILERIMHDIAPGTKPCDYFDLIGGTSTGGLIALMLGRLRMSIKECIDAYCRLSQTIFDERLVKMLLMLLKAHKFSHHKLKDAVEEVVAKHRGRSSTKMRDVPGEDICRTFVVAIQGCGVDLPPKLFRTYDNQFLEQRADDCEIWEAARATSCAPSFFPDIEVQGVHYSDGGLGYNNPAQLVLAEARSLWGRDHDIGCLLSVGTGSKESFMHIFKNPTHLIKLPSIFQDMATNCEIVHKSLEANPFVKGFYFRFNPTLEKDIGLSEWAKIKELKGIAWQYIGENMEKIDSLAESLRAKEGKSMNSFTVPNPIAPPPYKRAPTSPPGYVFEGLRFPEPQFAQVS